MKGSTVSLVAQILVILLLFILLHAAYQGMTTKPTEIDSIYYHIPIAKSYLTGDIFTSPKSPILHRFFPGASEGILALFMLLHIPLNLYNVLGAACLFFALVYLGKRAGLQTVMAYIFAAGFSLVTGIARWLNIQVVDIFMAVWYAVALGLLLKPVKEYRYALSLGAALGMAVGTKYSGPLLAFILLIFFSGKLIKTFRPVHWIIMAIPLLVLGGFWYIRNFLVMGNPLYPLALLAFPGVPGWALEIPVWKAILTKPLSMGNAVLSEFLGWPLLILGGVVLTAKRFVAGKKIKKEVLIFFALSLLNFAVYALLPNGGGYRVHVSNLRYSYPVFIPAVLFVFLLVKEMKWDERLALLVFFQSLFVLQVAYHPKLLLVFIPLAFLVWKKMDKLLHD